MSEHCSIAVVALLNCFPNPYHFVYALLILIREDRWSWNRNILVKYLFDWQKNCELSRVLFHDTDITNDQFCLRLCRLYALLYTKSSVKTRCRPASTGSEALNKEFSSSHKFWALLSIFLPTPLELDCAIRITKDGLDGTSQSIPRLLSRDPLSFLLIDNVRCKLLMVSTIQFKWCS